ncbi:hypothetical protein GKC30_02435 [Pseudodesulfovibrio sp. F-1]|uniref:Uncharacterized protein n=1 Tax=Pseudodesulfovibrio alkaliphilus TaxID=2661613 RepID=A0A7K1KK91_9BACT|nr:hypothetical protein [Pseudodesulfovibrio alkaliphilus]MUM76487.1 hypothetical protein [Pseudodesulfovibrio alkaliphilus]
MRRLCRILVVAAAVVFLTLSQVAAESKFINKDTARDRRNNTFGTEQSAETATATFGTNGAGDSTIKVKPRPKPEEVDWYDKVIITVNPETKWPASGTSSSTRSTTTYDSATDSETRTTTTEERNW